MCGREPECAGSISDGSGVGVVRAGKRGGASEGQDREFRKEMMH